MSKPFKPRFFYWKTVFKKINCWVRHTKGDCWTKLQHFILGQFKSNKCWPKLQHALQELCSSDVVCPKSSFAGLDPLCHRSHNERKRISLVRQVRIHDPPSPPEVFPVGSSYVVCVKRKWSCWCAMFFYSCHSFWSSIKPNKLFFSLSLVHQQHLTMKPKTWLKENKH